MKVPCHTTTSRGNFSTCNISAKLTNKEIYAIVKKPTITEIIQLHRLCWFGHVQRMEENRIPKTVLHMNLETRPRGRP
jgi:hypothetical protein